MGLSGGQIVQEAAGVANNASIQSCGGWLRERQALTVLSQQPHHFRCTGSVRVDPVDGAQRFFFQMVVNFNHHGPALKKRTRHAFTIGRINHDD